nr:hypothetical protein [Tanacetum cinerariifolium]
MSDSDESGVTYTDVSSPFEELSGIGSPRADDHEHLELPEILEDPYVEDPVDYPTDGGDDGDDEEGSSEDDEDDSRPMRRRRRSTQILPTLISIPAPVPVPACSDSEVIRLLAMSSPPPLPLSHWSSPPPHIPFPPLPPILSPPSLVEDKPEVTLPPRKRLRQYTDEIYAAAARPSRGLRADYGFVATMDREIMRDLERERLGCPKRLGYDRQMRQIVISEMLRADHRRSTEIIGLRTALQGQVTALQGQVTALQVQVTALQRQQGLAEGPTQPELPGEAGSRS